MRKLFFALAALSISWSGLGKTIMIKNNTNCLLHVFRVPVSYHDQIQPSDLHISKKNLGFMELIVTEFEKTFDYFMIQGKDESCTSDGFIYTVVYTNKNEFNNDPYWTCRDDDPDAKPYTRSCFHIQTLGKKHNTKASEKSVEFISI